MIKSMTGFGRGEQVNDDRKIVVEIKAVNHRFCDMNVKLPKKLNYFETDIRTCLKEYIQRGKVDVFITYEDYTKSNVCVKYNKEIATEYVNYLNSMVDDFGLQSDVKPSVIGRFPEVFTLEEQSVDEKEVNKRKVSTRSNDQGRAYEHACMLAMCERIQDVRNIRIVDNSSLHANEKAWKLMDEETQQVFMTSAEAAVGAVIKMEPKILENDNDDLILEFQQDRAGVKGDVRDIVIRRNDIGWEIGLSIKHNHDAVKHSRLSHKIDFGKEWFGLPCSDDYWDAVKPIFDMLKDKKDRGVRWSDMDDKNEKVYVPLLQAFMDEINRAYKEDSNIPRKMIEYLIGTEDYYKIVSRDNKKLTSVYTFNMHNTLDMESEDMRSETVVPVVELPIRIETIRFKQGSRNTVEMFMDNNWQLSFRIHNASTKVEPSLKFDIQFIKMPTSILNIECQWQ